MKTDWELVRAMMASAIDACERLEELELNEGDREAVANVEGQQVSVFDILTSAWTYPETLRYQIIRQRHEMALDQAYVPEAARILVNVAQACAELVGSGKPAPADDMCRKMAVWYREHATPLAERAITDRQAKGPQIP